MQQRRRACSRRTTLTDTSTTTPTSTSTPTDASTETATPTDTETATDTPTETESPTETPEPTPEPEDRELTEAANYVQSALKNYIEAGHLADARLERKASTDNIQNQEMFEARQLLNELEEESLSNTQQARHKRIWNAFWFVWWVGPTHNAVRTAYQERPSRDGSGYQNFRDAISAAEGELDQLKNDSDVSGFEELSDYSTGEYEDWIDRFEGLIEDCGDIADVAEQITSVQATFEKGMSQHDSEQYGDAIDTFD